MSEVFRGDDPSEVYLRLRSALLDRGREVSPRGHRTLELPAVSVVLEDPTRSAPTGVGRNLVAKIGAAEACNLIGGFSDADMLVNCAKNFSMFVEGPSGHRLMGAYGPRVSKQWDLVLRQLSKDADTRQAGVNLWRYDELREPSRDVPCTLSLFYQIRDGKLEAFTTMRSQDLVWGSPYDWMQFTAAQRALAYALGVGLGPYTHVAYSLHAYVDRDDISVWDRGEADEFTQPPPYLYEQVQQSPDATYALAKSRWGWVQESFKAIAGIEPEPEFHPNAHYWYEDVLEGTQSGGKLCWGCKYVLPDNEDHFPDCWSGSGQVGLCYPCVQGY